MRFKRKLLNVQLNVVQVELSQSLQLDAKGPNGVLFTYSVRAFFINPILAFIVVLYNKSV